LYHGVPVRERGGIPGSVFEQHILFLKQHCQFVPADDVDRRRTPLEKPRIVLTFDDGFRNNADVVAPILRKHGIPALFFVSSRHSTAGKYLWFSYLRAIDKYFPGEGFHFRERFFDMSPAHRPQSMHTLRRILLSLVPHPAAMYEAIEKELPRLEDFISDEELTDSYAGMTFNQVAELSADHLFSIGAHTVDHPFLTLCTHEEARRQIEENRRWVEDACGRSCDAFAYPGGAYNRDVLTICRSAGFTRGYAVSPRMERHSPFELARIGIYSESTDVLGFKVQWGHAMRRLGIPVG
jgi:peptidoglycan/xylan/chitin deacetylase (PgdA/CDA1 family)